jgi:hypothetical protein
MKVFIPLLLAAVVAGCAQGGVVTSAPATPPPASEEGTPTPAPTATESLEPAVEPTPEATPDTTPTRFVPGEPITITNEGEAWATVTIDRVKQVKRYNGPYNIDDVPKKGNIYIELRVTYVALQDGVDYNPFDWQVFVDGVAADDYTFVSNGPEPQLNSGTLPKGRKATGYLVYEVAVSGEVLFSYKGNIFSNEAPVFEVILRAK